MDLEYVVTDIESVPEAARGFYAESNGSYVLKVKGAVAETEHSKVKNDLKQFRDNNISLMQENSKFKALATIVGEDGLNPDKLQARIEDLANQRVTEMKTNYESQLSEVATKHKSAQAMLETYILNDVVKNTALKHGVVESALVDVVNRARDSFAVVEGKVAAKDGTRNKKGDPLSVEDWVTALSETAPHFFGTTSGAGATRSEGGGNVINLSAHEKISAGLKRLRK